MEERPHDTVILVDTGVWIDFFTGKTAWYVDELESLLLHKKDICICGVVLSEVLQGIRHTRDYRRIKKLFEDIIFLPMTRDTFVHSADIYRSLRRKGITIRASIDCMIAAVAIQHRVPLLHSDKDFDIIAQHTSLKVIKEI